MTDINLNEICPIRCVIDKIGDRWSLLIVHVLAKKNLGFNDIYKNISDISKQSLSKRLKSLEIDGYIFKNINKNQKSGFEYSLTELGRSFTEPLNILIEWAVLNKEKIIVKRKSFLRVY